MTNSVTIHQVAENGVLSRATRAGALPVGGGFPFREMVEIRAVDLVDPGKSIPAFTWDGLDAIKTQGVVGVVRVGSTVVEILPKTWRAGTDPADGRQILERMIESHLEDGMLSRPSARRLHAGHLATRPGTIGDRIFEQLVVEAENLLQTGLRFAYSSVSEQRPFLRGRLDLGRQMRRPPGRDHLFEIRHQRFHPNRPENRLVKAALLRVASRSTDPTLRTRAAQVSEIMAEVPPSRAVRRDLEQWDSGRLLAHYAGIRPWCRLVLEPMVGLTAGDRFGEAWLWRTDKMFERHLEERVLARMELVAPDAEQICQGESGWYLGTHPDMPPDRQGVFGLDPDIAIRRRGEIMTILDAKWKVAKIGGAETREARTPVSREDAYQMYAYGQRLMNGRGPLVLVYPSTEEFQTPVRHFLGNLALVAVPFDIRSDTFLLGEGSVGSDVQSALGSFVSQLLATQPLPRALVG